MKKSEEKRKLVEELTTLYDKLNVEQLFRSPNHINSKGWLSEIAAILKNLDEESDFQTFASLRQHIYGSIPSSTRRHAAEQIDGFVRQKVAEYQRCDFSHLDRKSFNFPKIKLPIWIARNIEKISITIVIAAVLAWLGLS